MAWNKCRSQVPFPCRAVRAQASFTLCGFPLIVMPYCPWFFPHVLFDNDNGLSYMYKSKSEGAFIPATVVHELKPMCGGWMKRQCWQYLLICRLWPDGSKAMAGWVSSLISISESAGPSQNRWASISFLFLFLKILCRHASRFQVGFLFPVQAECRLWAEKQYCVQRAAKKLHVAILTSLCKETLSNLHTAFQLWLFTYL